MEYVYFFEIFMIKNTSEGIPFKIKILLGEKLLKFVGLFYYFAPPMKNLYPL